MDILAKLRAMLSGGNTVQAGETKTENALSADELKAIHDKIQSLEGIEQKLASEKAENESLKTQLANEKKLKAETEKTARAEGYEKFLSENLEKITPAKKAGFKIIFEALENIQACDAFGGVTAVDFLKEHISVGTSKLPDGKPHATREDDSVKTEGLEKLANPTKLALNVKPEQAEILVKATKLAEEKKISLEDAIRQIL